MQFLFLFPDIIIIYLTMYKLKSDIYIYIQIKIALYIYLSIYLSMYIYITTKLKLYLHFWIMWNHEDGGIQAI